MPLCSPTAVAIVVSPTGPPLNFSIIDSIIQEYVYKFVRNIADHLGFLTESMLNWTEKTFDDDLQDYAYHYNFPLLFSLPMVQTQGTAIHVSNGVWVTAAHVVAGGLDVYLYVNEDIKITFFVLSKNLYNSLEKNSSKNIQILL